MILIMLGRHQGSAGSQNGHAIPISGLQLYDNFQAGAIPQRQYVVGVPTNRGIDGLRACECVAALGARPLDALSRLYLRGVRMGTYGLVRGRCNALNTTCRPYGSKWQRFALAGKPPGNHLLGNDGYWEDPDCSSSRKANRTSRFRCRNAMVKSPLVRSNTPLIWSVLWRSPPVTASGKSTLIKIL